MWHCLGGVLHQIVQDGSQRTIIDGDMGRVTYAGRRQRDVVREPGEHLSAIAAQESAQLHSDILVAHRFQQESCSPELEDDGMRSVKMASRVELLFQRAGFVLGHLCGRLASGYDLILKVVQEVRYGRLIGLGSWLQGGQDRDCDRPGLGRRVYCGNDDLNTTFDR